MPELPEVETVRAGLAPALVGRRIERVEARRPDLRFPLPERFSERVSGQTVTALERRAKYLIATLSSGDDLVIHLGMTGRLSVFAEGRAVVPGSYVYDTGADPRHDHVVLHTSGGGRIVYNDPRRFGFMMLIPAQTRAQHDLFCHLGTEPLGREFTAEYLASRAKGRRVNLKALLMDQRVIAGLGNIYVSEALHRAGLSPKRMAATLAGRRGEATPRAANLVAAITSVLGEAIAAGGSTLRDYRQANGDQGSFQERFAVYDRAGGPCPTPGCGGIIRRAVQSNRATYYCAKCQR